MATFWLLLGLGMTVVLLGIAGAPLGLLYPVGAYGQQVEPGRVGRTGDIARAEVVEVAAQKKLSRWTTPGLAHSAVIYLLDVAEVLLRPVRPDLADASSSGATTAPPSEQ